MPKTATPRKPETVSRKLAETRNTSKNRSLSSLLGIGDNEKRLATDIGSGLNDVIGRGTIASLLGLPADLGGLLWDGGAWVNNKIKDAEYATGMLKPDLASLVTGQRKGYVPYSQGNPYLGAEDIGNRMEQAGLVSDVRRPKTELLASLISPAQAATAGYKAPQMARAGVQMMDNLASAPTMARMGQRGAVETNLKGLQGLVGGGDNAPMKLKGYHGGAKIENGDYRIPAFFGESADDVDWYVNEGGGHLNTADLSFNKPLDITTKEGRAHLYDVARRLGIDIGKEGEFYAPEIAKHSPYEGTNDLDLVYIPQVREALLKDGYDGIKASDTLTNYEIPAWVALTPDVIQKPVGNLGKMVAPQDEALRVAQANAAKPVSEGGLGLRPDNTPEERAAAMGFDTPAFHGRYRDYSAVKDGRTFYASQDPEYASIYTNPSASSMGGKSMGDFDNTTPNVMPVMLRSGDILDTRTPRGKEVFDNQFYMQYGNGSPLTERGVPDWVDAEDFGEMYADTGSPYKGVWADEGGVPMPDGSVKLRGLSAAIFDPTAIRSRFAAFDPMRRDSSDLLAGIAPFGAVPWLRDEEP